MVIGAVLPPGFQYENIDLWLPLNRFWGQIDEMRGNHWFRGIGKLKSGVTLDRARTDLDATTRDQMGRAHAARQGRRLSRVGCRRAVLTASSVSSPRSVSAQCGR
jgi:hypothetical protein